MLFKLLIIAAAILHYTYFTALAYAKQMYDCKDFMVNLRSYGLSDEQKKSLDVVYKLVYGTDLNSNSFQGGVSSQLSGRADVK